MTRQELYEELYTLTGNHAKVAKIFVLFGKLAPEPKFKPQVPEYDQSMVHRVREKINFTPAQRIATRTILRKMGMI